MFWCDLPRFMKYSYVIIDDNPAHVSATKAMADGFESLVFVGSATNYNDALDLILERKPDVIFLETTPENAESALSFHLMDAAYRFLKDEPRFIVTSADGSTALDALRRNAFDFLLKPFLLRDFRQVVLKLEKLAVPTQSEPLLAAEPEKVSEPEVVADLGVDNNDSDSLEIIETSAPEPIQVPVEYTVAKEKPLIICVKSYGDYRFINADDICYLQADNNSTDLHLANGEMITAFKTLKHFENVLKTPFVRIHNSYIVNIDYVSRIHTGNSVCYIKDTTTKLPFSKSYKENIDAILTSITQGNYLEI